MFKRNLGTPDRIARALVGIILIYIGFIDQTLITSQVLRILIGLFGALNLFGGIVSFCPLYRLADINTYKGAKSDD